MRPLERIDRDQVGDPLGMAAQVLATAIACTLSRLRSTTTDAHARQPDQRHRYGGDRHQPA